MNIVVLMKTHVWTEDLENYALKIYYETKKNNIDYFILMHCRDDKPYDQVKSNIIKKIIHKLTDEDIKSLYPVGFYNMWLSNHWLLMWFYKQYGQNYDYVWTTEYDVRISGDSSKIWNCELTYDFMYPLGNYRNPKNKYNSYYVGDKLTEPEKYHGYLQLSRYSNKFLAYLHDCFVLGENGQDELIIFSLANRGKFTKSSKFLQSIIGGMWTWQDVYSCYNRRLYMQLEATGHPERLAIFHPVK